jgi:hypothetical protein
VESGAKEEEAAHDTKPDFEKQEADRASKMTTKKFTPDPCFVELHFGRWGDAEQAYSLDEVHVLVNVSQGSTRPITLTLLLTRSFALTCFLLAIIRYNPRGSSSSICRRTLSSPGRVRLRRLYM